MCFFFRLGSVIADFALNFQQTGNETILPTALKVLNDSVQNTSSIGDLQIDPASVTLEGKELPTREMKKLLRAFVENISIWWQSF